MARLFPPGRTGVAASPPVFFSDGRGLFWSSSSYEGRRASGQKLFHDDVVTVGVAGALALLPTPGVNPVEKPVAAVTVDDESEDEALPAVEPEPPDRIDAEDDDEKDEKLSVAYDGRRSA